MRFDPLINYSKNKLIYKKFFHFIFNKIQVEKIHSVTTGHFRMPNNFFNKLVNIRPEDSLIFNKLKSEKLLEYQSLYFEKDLIQKSIDSIKILSKESDSLFISNLNTLGINEKK